jgi:phage tail-like protein
MARATTKDFLQGHRFFVRCESEGGLDLLQPGIADPDPRGGLAGFNSVTAPDFSVEAVEYRDGISHYTVKQAGFPQIGDITLQRGVIRQDTSFYEWALRAIRGNAYRADMTILIFPAEAMIGREFAGRNALFDESLAYKIKCFECFPTNVGAWSLDATGADIIMMEATFTCEYMSHIKPGEPDTTARF